MFIPLTLNFPIKGHFHAGYLKSYALFKAMVILKFVSTYIFIFHCFLLPKP